MSEEERIRLLSRRSAMGLIGGAIGGAFVAGCGGGSSEVDGTSSSSSSSSSSGSYSSASSTCSETLAKTQGPYWVDVKLNRSDIRTDSAGSAGTQSGALLTLTLYVEESGSSGCTPLEGVYVDIWHANGLGVYSDESVENTSGENYLRGYQVSDSDGKVTFTTIFPGWYSGRAPHIHVRFRSFDSSGNTTYDNTTQLFFSPTLTDTIYASYAPYDTRSQIDPDTSNSSDSIYDSSLLMTLSSSGSGYAGAYTFGYPLSGTGN
jgi:protocatechuate 3,4-dioxygenase beta subunit